MIVSLVLGMGLTTTACYVILAVLVAPAMIKMGIDPMAAHMFVFFFGMYSFITPPVSLGAFAAAGIAGSSPMATGYLAWKIALPGFILPFIFVFYPAMLMKGSWPEILSVAATGLVGVLFASTALVGFLRRNLNLLERGALITAGILLIHGGLVTDVLGMVLGALRRSTVISAPRAPMRPTPLTPRSAPIRRRFATNFKRGSASWTCLERGLDSSDQRADQRCIGIAGFGIDNCQGRLARPPGS